MRPKAQAPVRIALVRKKGRLVGRFVKEDVHCSESHYMIAEDPGKAIGRRFRDSDNALSVSEIRTVR